jgi:hypothetical protein
VILALGELMLPPCGLRPNPGFIRVFLMLRLGSPDWLWHLMTASLFLLPNAPSA